MPQYGASNTYNYYEPVTTATTWTAAEAYAATQTFGGQTGHLVTVRSAAEGTFLYGLVGSQTYWTGLTNSSTYGGSFQTTNESSWTAPATGSPPYTPTVTINTITHSGHTATATAATALASTPLASGQYVTIAGATPSQYDGTFAITVTGTYTFTYTMGTSPSSNASGTMTAVGLLKGYGFAWADGDAFTYGAWQSTQPNASSNPAYVAATSSSGAWTEASSRTRVTPT